MRFKTYIFAFLMIFSSNLFAETGKDIFDGFCTVCHSPAMSPMFNSPAAHDLTAWGERKENAFNRALEKNASLKNVSKDEKEVAIIDELIKVAIDGTDKGMPPMGTCVDCTKDQLKDVITFMSSAE